MEEGVDLDLEEIECINCSRFFYTVMNSIYGERRMCGNCLIESMAWRKCGNCGSVVATDPCHICKAGKDD